MKRLVLVAVAACSAPAHEPVTPPPPAGPHTLTLIGTNDLHGQIERVAILAGYVANVRAARAADGGAVVLVDAGDMFQGTLESNLAEGADVVRAYNRLGYAAAAIGNHEFDYGPVGPHVTAAPGEDPRGALEARIAEAKFPILSANLADEQGARVPWAKPSVIVDTGFVKVGILGISTASTPTTTMPANFKGLRILSAAHAIVEEAKALRAQGAGVVIATMHVGSDCTQLDNPEDDSSCDRDTELYKVMADVPAGTLDAIVAGHTHAGVAQKIAGTPVIESFSQGRAFGRIDLTIAGGKPTATHIYAPQLICPLDERKNPVPVAACHPDAYEGKAVVSDDAIVKIAAESIARAGAKRDEKLGVTLSAIVTKAYKEESAEGDLFCELMLAAQPGADVAMTNGGGLRTDLPAGDLTYGQFFEAMPFDNRFSLVDVTGAQLRELVTKNLEASGGILSWANLWATASCDAGKLRVDIDVAGKPLDDGKRYSLVTSDFLTSGGDQTFARLGLAPSAIHATDMVIRDGMADVLRSKKGTTIDPATLLARRHLQYSGNRPVHCRKDEP